jgi:hypothetical protein
LFSQELVNGNVIEQAKAQEAERKPGRNGKTDKRGIGKHFICGEHTVDVTGRKV